MILSILVVRIYIHGQQRKKKTVSNEITVLKLITTNKKLCCASTMEKLQEIYWFDVETVEEYQILENLAKLFILIDDAVAGGEKLFKYSRASVFVRLLKSKPSRIRLWMFQAAVVLECALPVLIYSKMKNSCMGRNCTMRCAEIVKEWRSLILNCFL